MSGFWHILEGTDHLLFLLCLVVPFRRLRPLIIIVTSFTVGHSISLIASAFGFVPDALWFPPLIETLIAVTIIYMALENIVYAAMGTLASDLSRRWIIAFAFGIVHGFGFSFALRESLQFAGDHLITALFGFNLGVEIGQIAVLLVLIPALDLLFKYVVAERLGVIILSALIAHIAWHWMIERGEQLAKFPFPRIDAAFLASAMRGLMAALFLALGVSVCKQLAEEMDSGGKIRARQGRRRNASRLGELVPRTLSSHTAGRRTIFREKRDTKKGPRRQEAGMAPPLPNSAHGDQLISAKPRGTARFLSDLHM